MRNKAPSSPMPQAPKSAVIVLIEEVERKRRERAAQRRAQDGVGSRVLTGADGPA